MSDGPDSNAIRRGWYYVVEAETAPSAPPDTHVVARDGRVLTRRAHGFPARVEVTDASGEGLPRVTLLRAADAVGAALEQLGDGTERAIRVRLGPVGSPERLARSADGVEVLELVGPTLAAQPSRHASYERALELLTPGAGARSRFEVDEAALPARPVGRALFFESLMNTEMEHNDKELSQGVLHMVSPLRGTETAVVLADVKMSIHQKFRNDPGPGPLLIGLDSLEEALAGGEIGLVCITLLEAYFHSVVEMVQRLRELGCRAHVAVGGVMPTLTPEHVAAHLPDVSFVCRGAGEYFVPALCRIVGDGDIDVALTEAQRAALLQLDGMLVVDRAGGRLLACNDARPMQVEELDGVDLDLAHVRRDHLQHGLEISTSRGCVYRCTFCTIIGQQTFQARSAGSVIDLLGRYEARFTELFGASIPPRVRRVHISDDDFACDKQRAAEFFRRLLDTPFRLASCQVSIADLCRRRGARLLFEPDEELLDAIAPECFFDSGRPITRREYIEDHGPRRWSAHLQAGVESFNDAELTRHGKGYKVEHLRVAMAALAERGLHLDAYYIVSSAYTTAEQLVEGLEEICRLKLLYPVHFHVKFPVTPRLVSIFPSASYRRHLKQGTTDAIVLGELAQEPNHPEYDYPFAEHDRPFDPLVDRAVSVAFFSDRHRYTETLSRLGDLWGEGLDDMPDGPDRRRTERLMRRLDDGARRRLFGVLAEVGIRGGAAEPREGTRHAQREALETAIEILGPAPTWSDAYRRARLPGAASVTAVVSDRGRGMRAPTLARCFDLVTSTERGACRLTLESDDATGTMDLLAAVTEELRAASPSPRPVDEIVLRVAAIDVAQLARAAGMGLRVKLLAGHVGASDLRDAQGSPAAPWTAEVRIEPQGAAAIAAIAHAAVEAGAVGVALVTVGSWTEAQEAALSRALHALGEASPDLPVEVERSQLPTLIVTPDGAIEAAGETVGALADLGNVDRYSMDAPRPKPTRAARIVESFADWMQLRAQRA